MKVLKIINKTIILIIVIFTIQSCYKDSINRHYYIQFKNSTEKTLYVDNSFYAKYLSPLNYLDTTLPCCCDPRNNRLATIVEPSGENPKTCFRRAFYESAFGVEFDTLLVFVFDEDTLESLGWDSVCANYKVLQRYDFSLEDLQYLDFKLCFPPSEAMKQIHMWPPYGTYDENGNCRTIK